MQTVTTFVNLAIALEMVTTGNAKRVVIGDVMVQARASTAQ
jgi:hypothetical protein